MFSPTETKLPVTPLPKPQFGKTRNSLSSIFFVKRANAIRNIWVNLQLEVKRYCTLWNLRNFIATVFSQKFRQINVLLKNCLYYRKLSWRKIIAWHGSEFLVFPHCGVWKLQKSIHSVVICEIFSYATTFSKIFVKSAIIFSNFFSEMLLSRNFRKITIIHNIYGKINIFSVKSTFLL